MSIYLEGLTPQQREIAECPASFIVAFMARQTGKTYLGIKMALEQALKHPNSRIFMIGLSTTTINRVIRFNLRDELSRYGREDLLFTDNVERMDFRNGSVIRFITAGSGDSINCAFTGSSFHLVIADEADYYSTDAFNALINNWYRAYSNRDGEVGKMVFLSTPCDRLASPMKLYYEAIYEDDINNEEELDGSTTRMRYPTPAQTFRVSNANPDLVNQNNIFMSPDTFQREMLCEWLGTPS